MESVRYQGWLVEVDREATRAAYASRGPGSATLCGCDTCRNFVAARELGLVYPRDALALFAKLGIDPNGEIDLYTKEPGPEQMPLLEEYNYAGWFNLVGRLVLDDKDFSQWNNTFDIYPMAEAAASSPGFDGREACRIEFEVLVPWVLREGATAPYS